VTADFPEKAFCRENSRPINPRRNFLGYGESRNMRSILPEGGSILMQFSRLQRSSLPIYDSYCCHP
jgi:hypothetical protein